MPANMQRGLHSVRYVDMQQHRSVHSSDMHSSGQMLDSELMHGSEGEGLEQGQRELRWDVMLGVDRHGHVLLRTSQMLDSELMHGSEGEGLEQGQRELRWDVMLGVDRHGHVLRLQGWLYVEEQRVCSQCVQLPRWHASCREWHWRHTV